MNLYNPGPHTYTHAYNGKPIRILPAHLCLGLSGLEVEHCLKHNPMLELWHQSDLADYDLPEGAQDVMSGRLVFLDLKAMKKKTGEPALLRKTFTCPDCEQSFKTKSGYLSHQRTHLHVEA